MYNVVFRTLVPPSTGVLTWSTFQSKEAFDAWNDEKMRSWYEVVAEGVTQEHAIALCSTPEAELAVVASTLQEAKRVIDKTLASL